MNSPFKAKTPLKKWWKPKWAKNLTWRTAAFGIAGAAYDMYKYHQKEEERKETRDIRNKMNRRRNVARKKYKK
tara:strand:+ start:495 stop:713 length:219 start_codon:yes stop_codon:yes gene_type:complete